MNKTLTVVATAIRDMESEGKVAATLTRLGFRVLYRATSLDGLIVSTQDEPEVIVIASDDFKGIKDFSHPYLLMLQGNTFSKSHDSKALPESDAEFLQLIQSLQLRDQVREDVLPSINKDVTTITSIGRDSGCTTFAINYAAELSEKGESVLLIDAHVRNPSIADYLDLYGLRQAIFRDPSGFSLTEVDSVADLRRITSECNSYSKIVIDLGELTIDARTSTGRRFEDVVSTWALNSTTKMILLSGSRISHLKGISAHLSKVKKVSEISSIYIGILLKQLVSKKTQQSLIEQIDGALREYVAIFPYDRRAITEFELTHRPLISSHPKSHFRREIEEWVSRLES